MCQILNIQNIFQDIIFISGNHFPFVLQKIYFFQNNNKQIFRSIYFCFNCYNCYISVMMVNIKQQSPIQLFHNMILIYSQIFPLYYFRYPIFFYNIFIILYSRIYRIVVSTSGFNPEDLGSNPSRSYFLIYFFILYQMIEFLSKADQFGIPFTQSIQKGEKQFRSPFGGLVSILLYGTSLAYFIYKIYLWQTNQILPKVSSQESSNQYMEMDFKNYNPISITVKIPGAIDPFNLQNNILTPYIQYVDGTTFGTPQLLIPEPSQSPGFSSQLTPTNITLVLNNKGITSDSPKIQRQAFILFEICDKIKEQNLGIRCATQDVQKEFFQGQFNILFLYVIINQFDTMSQIFKKVPKQVYIALDNTTASYGQLIFTLTKQKLDDNLLFDNYRATSFISNLKFIIQQLSLGYFYQGFQMNIITGFLIRIDSTCIQQNVLYPKLGEILADVGSIMSTLLILKILVVIVNQKLMEDTVYSRVISFYYPEFQDIKIQRNYLGKMIKVTRNNQQLDKVQFQKTYSQLRDRAKLKLTVTNQIYEISRLQFLLQSQISRSNIKQSHSIGIRMNFNNITLSEDSQHDDKAQQLLQQDILTHEDFGILSLNKFQSQNIEQEQNVKEFFTKNKI
ncbi:hypothetical protein pb186bvf_006572 [Paramecium bursaria]